MRHGDSSQAKGYHEIPQGRLMLVLGCERDNITGPEAARGMGCDLAGGDQQTNPSPADEMLKEQHRTHLVIVRHPNVQHWSGCRDVSHSKPHGYAQPGTTTKRRNKPASTPQSWDHGAGLGPTTKPHNPQGCAALAPQLPSPAARGYSGSWNKRHNQILSLPK